ncbi:MAG: PEGA domain-containing protein [Terracidiphilus sp.]
MRYKTSEKILLASILLSPAALAPQMPPQPGRLAISSDPQGAIVTINGQRVDQHTNATFVVSPGTYTVSVSLEGKLNCPGTSLTVSAGQTVARECTASGWR